MYKRISEYFATHPPILGLEIEFYTNVPIYDTRLRLEKGLNQYEFDLGPTKDFYGLVSETRSMINYYSKLGAIFSPKPFKNDYGNSMQIHLNFDAPVTHHLYNIDYISNILCSNMLNYFLIYAPTEECYERFVPCFMAPINVSRGLNNRTTAIRIPAGSKRVEYRIPSPSCDLELVIISLLYQIMVSVDICTTTHPVIFGNAHDPQYNLEAFPKNIYQAANILDAFCELGKCNTQ